MCPKQRINYLLIDNRKTRRKGIGEPKQAVKGKGEMSGLQWEGAANRAEKVLVKDSI